MGVLSKYFHSQGSQVHGLPGGMNSFWKTEKILLFVHSLSTLQTKKNSPLPWQKPRYKHSAKEYWTEQMHG